MKAAEDFLEVVLFAHVIAAAEQVMKTGNLPTDCKEVADSIIDNYIKVSIPTERTSNNDTVHPGVQDSVYTYATDFLTMALIWYGFHDSIKMGDGNRIMNYWKFMTAIFKQTGHNNYAKEGFLMLAQSAILSSRQSAELKWSRTVNTHGCAGNNIPVDLHMEHLNRRMKDMMRGLGSNITPESVQRASKALGVIEAVCTNFEKSSNVTLNKEYHSIPSFERDLKQLSEQLVREEVFAIKDSRHHQRFSKHRNLMKSIDWKKMNEWVKEQILNYDTY